MKWPIIAIVIFVVGYTLVNLYFRKPGPAYRPYQDAQDRATLARLVAAGWHTLPVDLRRPTERPPTENIAKTGRGSMGLGLNFEANFAEKPKLLAAIDRVTAPASINQGETYRGFFTARITPDLKTELGDLALYFKAHELVLVPTLDTLPGDVRSRWEDADYAFSFSTASLSAGTYQIRIVANGPAVTWSFTVR